MKSPLVLRSISAAIVLFILGCGYSMPAQRRAPLVEEVRVVGYQRLAKEEILKHISTRVGEIYVQEKVNRDFYGLLDLGLFDKLTSRVLSENGARGGLVLTFELTELPLIQRVEFAGLPAAVPQAELLKALRAKANIAPDIVLDTANALRARRLIRGYLESCGWSNARVDIDYEKLEGNRVVVKFEISARF